MRVPIGIVLVVVGVILLVLGIQASNSFASDLSRLFTGNPTDRSVWLIIGGVVAILAGVGTAAMDWKALKKA
ncbi:MAG: DUF3185 family protein [Phycisphaeraceae bacterium]|nr:DUF3185 family protein [Phycisphaeraceae bacterium]